MTHTPQIFDRDQVRRMRTRALSWGEDGQFLRREIADRIEDRLSEINRRFERALIIGAPQGMSWPANTIIQAWSLCAHPNAKLVLDETALPLQDESVDLIISVLDLHWVDDLPGALIQMNRALKPDGLFLGALFCSGTLSGLKQAFLASDNAHYKGVSPHIAPFADIRDLGGLLQRAGFTMPVADVDWLTIRYQTALSLMQDLRKMGETNALFERRKTFSTKTALFHAVQHYESLMGDGKGVSADFAIGFLTGWAPGPGQPKPKRPGSATTRLADALHTREEKL